MQSFVTYLKEQRILFTKYKHDIIVPWTPDLQSAVLNGYIVAAQTDKTNTKQQSNWVSKLGRKMADG